SAQLSLWRTILRAAPVRVPARIPLAPTARHAITGTRLRPDRRRRRPEARRRPLLRSGPNDPRHRPRAVRGDARPPHRGSARTRRPLAAGGEPAFPRADGADPDPGSLHLPDALFAGNPAGVAGNPRA